MLWPSGSIGVTHGVSLRVISNRLEGDDGNVVP